MAITSTFGSIYFDIQARLTLKANLVKWIDEDNGQLEIQENEYRPNVIFPCVLIEFGPFTYEDTGRDIQEATGSVQLRIAYAPYSNTNSKTPGAYMEQGLKNYDVEGQVVAALQNWAPTGCTRLLRRQAIKENREMDNMRVRIISFAVSFTEKIDPLKYQETARPDPIVGTDMLTPT